MNVDNRIVMAVVVGIAAGAAYYAGLIDLSFVTNLISQK